MPRLMSRFCSFCEFFTARTVESVENERASGDELQLAQNGLYPMAGIDTSRRSPSSPSKCNRTKMLSVVAAGHASTGTGPSLRKLDPEVGKPATILKVLDDNEHDVYCRLAGDYVDDPVNEFVPAFHGIVEECDEKGEPTRFIRIDNLLHRFVKPKVMDVKLGTRTFLEKECQNMKLRPDLYKRMSELYPEDITDEDRVAEAITKHRFMQARDANTTISKLGYRVDGIAGYRAKSRKEVADELSKFRTIEDTCSAFHAFVEVCATNDGQTEGKRDILSLAIAKAILCNLANLCAAAEKSQFVKQHELIGSSILVVADASGQVGVFWIDFAKTNLMAEGGGLSHRAAWEMGNHEDGVQFGLDNLVRAWSSVVTELGGDHSSTLEKRMSSAAAESVLGISTSPDMRTRKPDEFSDLAVLSLLPTFDGRVADKRGTIYEGGISNAETMAPQSGSGFAGVAAVAAQLVGGWCGGPNQRAT